MTFFAKLWLFWSSFTCGMFALSVAAPRGYVAPPIFWLAAGIAAVVIYTIESRKK